MQRKGIYFSVLALNCLIAFEINADIKPLDHALSCSGSAIGGRVVSFALHKAGATKEQALGAGALTSLAGLMARRVSQEWPSRICSGGELLSDIFCTTVLYALTTFIVPVADRKQDKQLGEVSVQLPQHPIARENSALIKN